MPRREPSDAPEPTKAVTVHLTAKERQQMARATWAVTAMGEPGEINAMDAAIRKLRKAAGGVSG